MDPFNIGTPVDNTQVFASKFTPCLYMSERVRMPKDKWFVLKTNDEGITGSNR
jgi:hypothetical protein